MSASVIVTLTDIFGNRIVSGPELEVWEATFTDAVDAMRPAFVEYSDGRSERFRTWMPASVVTAR
jgi:hypothetical protein